MNNQGPQDRRTSSSSHLNTGTPAPNSFQFSPYEQQQYSNLDQSQQYSNLDQQQYTNPGHQQQQQQQQQLQQQQQQQFLDPQATLLDHSPSHSFDNTNFFGLQGQSQIPSQHNTPSLYSPNGSSSNLSASNLSPTSQLSATNLSLNLASPQSIPESGNNFPSFDFNQGQSLDPTLLYGNSQQSSNSSLDPMAATHQNPTPPHLLQADGRRSSQSPSPSASPFYQQTQFSEANRPRSESLDPASAAYPPPGYHGWGSGHNFQQHRRTASDAHSEVSTHSNQASPYLPTADSFDVSPMLNAQADPSLFSDALGLGQFSLSDTQIAPHISPIPSPHVSPQIVPQAQQALPEFNPSNSFALSPDFSLQQNTGFEAFNPIPNPIGVPEPFPQLGGAASPGDIGQADTMSPPEINIDFAPPSRQASFGPPSAANPEDALSPPPGNRNRNRTRAKSDTFLGSRPTTPALAGRGRSPSLQPGNALSPFDPRHSTSRSPSPSSHSSASGLSRHSSVSSVPQRDYILDLANPDRTAAGGSEPKRTQKHPATFQCHLCPKKFTRAYNLRSHLRTHTDERPFVCTVCGKAFARQHDRKRHESLHSGEKKFVCKGQLSNNETWGCGRRFARADALGRHFRSEAGRICIKPLLDEEAAERQRHWAEEHAQQQMQSNQGFVAPPPMMNQPHLHPILPAALLQMYPDLANLDWGAVTAPSIAEENENELLSGRSSFDASSGQDYGDLSENEIISFNGQPLNGNVAMMNGMGAPSNGWAGQDYLSDFEGR